MTKFTYAALKYEAVQLLANAGIENPAIDVRILLEKASGKSAADLIVSDQDYMPDTAYVYFQELLGARIAREPIAYILGEKAFWSLDFTVDENVLIPRPETEGLVERALNIIKDTPNPHILDIGTGSGAILISLLHELKSAAGVGADISPEALDIARTNALRNHVADRCTFIQSDYLSGIDEKFDVVVSNPPYIDSAAMNQLMPDVELYEPELALSGGADGLLAYRAIISGLHKVLKSNGHVVFEIGFDQKQAVCDLLMQAGASNIVCQQDLAGQDRILSAAFCSK